METEKRLNSLGECPRDPCPPGFAFKAQAGQEGNENLNEMRVQDHNRIAP